MPHLANLMIPDTEGNHPLSSHAFSAALAGVVSGDFSAAAGLNYLNNIVAKNGAAPLSTEAQSELSQIKANFDASNAAGKLIYFIKLSNYAFALEESAESGLTAAAFDNALGIV